MPKKAPQIESTPEKAQRGIASWYGSDFHGKPTASGEIFNMYEYTCAHKEYPFGTKLKVINLKNKKEVICTVNDRGPFVPGKDLDLSYMAARKIDILKTGTAEVLMQPVGRDYSYVRYVKYSPIAGVLTIQVGSFKEYENAYRLKQALSWKYQNVYISRVSLKGDRYYRVRVGKFTRYEEAFDLAKTMAQEGYKVIITKYDEKEI
ncbi:MAG: septal ring lytic transglycosylase RlpA family protein [Thermodesulfovibrionaceae bacterium]